MAELFSQKGRDWRAEQHHIASNECWWEDMSHHHVEYLWGPDSKYQSDSELEAEKVVLRVLLPTTTFSSQGIEALLLNSQRVASVEV